jgi:hypothetical protein
MVKLSVATMTVAVLLLGAGSPAAPPNAGVAASAGAPAASGASPMVGAKPAASTPMTVGAKPGAPRWELSMVPPEAGSGRLLIEGRVIGEDGRPRRDVRVHVHHAAPNGTECYPEDPRLIRSGLLRTNVLGEFRVRTQMPGMAEGVPHVHFELELPGPAYRTVGLILARPAGAGSDTAYARLPWAVSLAGRPEWAHVSRDSAGDYHCRWDLPLAKSIEMPRPEAFGGQ